MCELSGPEMARATEPKSVEGWVNKILSQCDAILGEVDRITGRTAPAYGFTGGHKIESLPSVPLAHEASVRAQAQSMLTHDGIVAELPGYDEALSIIRSAERY